VRAAERGGQVAGESVSLRRVEQAQIEQVVVHAGLGREAEPAPVGGRVGHHREGGAVPAALRLHHERHRIPVAQLAEACHPVGALAGQALEPGVDRAQRVGVETHARHQQEVPLARAPDRHAPDRARRDDAGHEVEAPGERELTREDVRRPARPHRERRGRADQRVDGFVDRPVAAVDDHQVDVGRRRLRGESRGVRGRAGDPGRDRDVVAAQEIDHPGDGVKPIALPACARIVDEDRGARHGPASV
jgi:hypothetical protein